jgi:hypothetical protein
LASKKETVFRRKLQKRLDLIPHSFWESIQQKAIIGTPDILGCIGPFFVAIEVKTNEGKLSELQKLKIGKIQKAGSLALVITPNTMEFDLESLFHLSQTLSKHDGESYDQTKL